MPTLSTTKMTAKQFFCLGEDPPGVRLELVDGNIAASPSPMPEHSYAEKRLSAILLNHIIEHKLGELLGDLDTVFGTYDVRRPDILYFRKERVGLIRWGEILAGVPDLCIEIVSPSSRQIDRKDKFEQYAEGDVPFYWIVDPAEQTIEAHRLSRGRYKLLGQGKGTDVVSFEPFPDLKIALAEIWFPRRGKKS